MQVYGIDSLLQSDSSGQSMNCSLSHFSVGLKREKGRLLLGFGPECSAAGMNGGSVPLDSDSIRPRVRLHAKVNGQRRRVDVRHHRIGSRRDLSQTLQSLLHETEGVGHAGLRTSEGSDSIQQKCISVLTDNSPW